MNLFQNLLQTDTAQQRPADPRPCLLEGILEGNAAELVLLLEAVRQLLQMHHQHLGAQSNTQQAYVRLIKYVQQLEEPVVPWIDLLWSGSDESSNDKPATNPDGPALRATILNVARTTLVQALVSCVAVQRRFVTGDIYGPGVDPTYKARASGSARVRYSAYRPVPETDVDGLMVYVHDHEHILIAKTVETLTAARKWLTVVLPDIRAHYLALQQEKEEEART